MPEIGDEVLVTFEHGKLWTGFLKNKRIKIFNLGNPSIRRDIFLEGGSKIWISRAGQARNEVVGDLFICVFDCPDPNILRGYDISHRLTRGNLRPSFDVIDKLRKTGYFTTIDLIKPDLSGLSQSGLTDIRKALETLRQNLNNSNSFKMANGMRVVIFNKDRVVDWNKSQEMRTR